MLKVIKLTMYRRLPDTFLTYLNITVLEDRIMNQFTYFLFSKIFLWFFRRSETLFRKQRRMRFIIVLIYLAMLIGPQIWPSSGRSWSLPWVSPNPRWCWPRSWGHCSGWRPGPWRRPSSRGCCFWKYLNQIFYWAMIIWKRYR